MAAPARGRRAGPPRHRRSRPALRRGRRGGIGSGGKPRRRRSSRSHPAHDAPGMRPAARIRHARAHALLATHGSTEARLSRGAGRRMMSPVVGNEARRRDHHLHRAAHRGRLLHRAPRRRAARDAHGRRRRGAPVEPGARPRAGRRDGRPPSHISGPSVRALWMQSAVPGLLAKTGADVGVFPNYAAPLASPCPTMVVVHDLAVLRVPAASSRPASGSSRGR